MANQTRVRDAAENFARTLQECGKSRAEAASELAAIADSLASEGNADRASVLMEVSAAMRCDAEIEQPDGLGARHEVAEVCPG